MMYRQWLAGGLLGLLAGCTTNYYLVDEMADQPLQHYPETVVVQPSADAEAMQMLQQSAIYHNDPQAEVTLQDATLIYYPACGNPLLVSGMTLGLLPVSIPDSVRLVYTLNHGGHTQIYAHDIWMESRTSVWEWLFTPFVGTESEVWAEGLQRSVRQAVPCADVICPEPAPSQQQR